MQEVPTKTKPKGEDVVVRKDYSSIEDRFYKVGDKIDMEYYRMPEELFYNRKYSELSLGAKSLYAVMLDRLDQSMKNNQRDDQGVHYFRFPTKPAKGDLRSCQEKPEYEWSMTEVLNCSARTIRRYKTELKELNLLSEIREGQGKTSRFYLAKP